MNRSILSLLVMGLGLSLTGCGQKGTTRHHVWGQVTYQGKPLPAGMILFDPDPTKGGDGPQGYARIKNGKFDTREGGRMGSEGANLASIQGFDGKEGPELPMGRSLFGQYITSVDLKADSSPLTIDVK